MTHRSMLHCLGYQNRFEIQESELYWGRYDLLSETFKAAV